MILFKTLMLAVLLEHFGFERLANISPELSSRVAFTRDLFFVARGNPQQHIPRKSDSG
jgi:hypothetical protein